MPEVSPSDLEAVLATFRAAATEAATIALRYFQPGGRTSARIEYKDGGSPVSDADFAVDRFLRDRLSAAMPEAAWLSEETADSPARLGFRHVLVVDPIDGTRGFVSGDAQWAVSIALVSDGRPVVGIVHAPVLDQSFTAVLGGGAHCNGTRIGGPSRTTLAEATVAAPANLSRLIAQPATFRIAPRIPSLACRLVHVAAGFIDGCVSGAGSNDWNIAAADLILHEADCLLTDRRGATLAYNRPGTTHPTLVASSRTLHGELLRTMLRPGD